MSKYEARIRTKFGEIVVKFDSVDELKSNTESLESEAVSDILSKRFESLIAKQVRQPKPGFEHIYQFTPSGAMEPVTLPDSKADKVAFVLFAYHPEPASVEQVAVSSGIKEVSSDYLTQASYKKYWSKTSEGKYLLSAEGLDWVTQKVIPKIKSKTGSQATEKAEPKPG